MEQDIKICQNTSKIATFLLAMLISSTRKPKSIQVFSTQLPMKEKNWPILKGNSQMKDVKRSST